MKLKVDSRGSRRRSPFSILERIDVGETHAGILYPKAAWPFSILERIDVGETSPSAHNLLDATYHLSVSSNGSTWVKRKRKACYASASGLTFSILERIDVGETTLYGRQIDRKVLAFSILERIDVGETF